MVRILPAELRSKLSFTLVDCVYFLPLLPAFALLVTALFTPSWLEEKWESKDGELFAYHRLHGLYKICTKKFVLGQQVSGISRFAENRHLVSVDGDDSYECMNRFRRACFETGCKLVDNVIQSYYDRVIGWEIACLILISISVVVNLVTIVSFVFVRKTCWPIISASLITIAFACSLTAVILFAAYHKGSDILKNKVLKMVLTETAIYGHSFWEAVAGCCCQFLVTIFLFVSAIRYCCNNACCTCCTDGRQNRRR